MSPQEDEAQFGRFLLDWFRSLAEKDESGAAALRHKDYIAVLQDGTRIHGPDEWKMLAASELEFEQVEPEQVSVSPGGPRAQLTARVRMNGRFAGMPIDGVYKFEFKLLRHDGRWQAIESKVREEGEVFNYARAVGAPARSIRHRVKSWLHRGFGSRVFRSTTSFQDLAYLPMKPGSDYALPLSPQGKTGKGSGELPVPPQHLWLGYNYPAHGAAHVQKMLEIVSASGCAFEPGDRILDLGCGAGRMIRHLVSLSEMCEIWGADISAEHIFWCKANLSPPFHFATTTKVPHLPFEDRSFKLIYCGSLFTHIDDLADSWFLELRRLLAPGGRLYFTVHDNHTMRLFDQPEYRNVPIVAGMRSNRTYQRAATDFGMFTIGRDHESQVFYHQDYLSRMIGGMFDILSITPEAYFYQTAYLVARKAPVSSQGGIAARS